LGAFAAALARVAAMPTMAGCVLLPGIGGAAATVTEVADGVLTQCLFTGDQLLRVVGRCLLGRLDGNGGGRAAGPPSRSSRSASPTRSVCWACCWRRPRCRWH
jgi:hypothetical protein